MPIYRSEAGDAALVSLEPDTDLLEGLLATAKDLDMRAGWIQVIGAAKRLAYGVYDQETQEYRTFEEEGQFEIAAAMGNVSLKDGDPFVHLHIVATRHDGSAIGGHLMPGTTVFVAEAWLQRLASETAPVREMDERRGLALWR